MNATLRASFTAAALLFAASLHAPPLLAQDTWTFVHKKPSFTIGIPRGWEEVAVISRSKADKALVARLHDPLTREDPVPHRVSLYSERSPAYRNPHELSDTELRIAPYRPGAGDQYDLLQHERIVLGDFPALLVVGEIKDRYGRKTMRVEATYEGAVNLYAVVYTVPASDFDWLQVRIRSSLESFRARDVPRNPLTVWIFGFGGLVLLAVLLVGLHRWMRG
jgi:hypothetical protein